MLLPVTLCAVAAAAILNIWLMARVGKVRQQYEIYIGDDGNEHVTRRMRAHANFVESAPLVLLLIAAIEISGKGYPWLPWVAAVYILGRIAHVFGMETANAGKFRAAGTILTLLTLLGLAIVAALIAARVL